MTSREGCVALNLISGVGFVKYSALVERFGSPEAVFSASREELLEVPGVGPQLAERISGFDFRREVERELVAAEKGGVRVFALTDPDYPEALRELYDPPLCLYWRGRPFESGTRTVAIVGSRRMSSYGARMTRAIAADAVAAGFEIVSGLALGVDTVAHGAAVEAKRPTLGVIGGGMINFYPRENLELARRIVETGGAVLSEFPLNFPVHRTNFPRRNRIVAALSSAVIVTEAGVESGALITARQGLELGREVFAVPGHADNPQAQGCHKLIKDGAGLVETFGDVMEALGFIRSSTPELPGLDGETPPSGLSADERRIFEFLSASGDADLDRLRAGTALETGELLSALMKLELKFLIERGDDQRYRLMTSRS